MKKFGLIFGELTEKEKKEMKMGWIAVGGIVASLIAMHVMLTTVSSKKQSK